jgi:hypothetical protein
LVVLGLVVLCEVEEHHCDCSGTGDTG